MLGPDRFPIFFFFKQFWSLVKDNLIQHFQEFHGNCQNVREIGASSIALIPKNEGVILIRDFRYIILIGSLYKTLGKVLVDGLRRVLPDVISKTQGAFVVRQKIVDTVLIAH